MNEPPKSSMGPVLQYCEHYICSADGDCTFWVFKAHLLDLKKLFRAVIAENPW